MGGGQLTDGGYLQAGFCRSTGRFTLNEKDSICRNEGRHFVNPRQKLFMQQWHKGERGLQNLRFNKPDALLTVECRRVTVRPTDHAIISAKPELKRPRLRLTIISSWYQQKACRGHNAHISEKLFV